MKILAFADLHEDYEYAEELERKAKHVDLIICAGDVTVFGDNLEQAMKFLDSLGKKVLLLHGNHESESSLRKACEKTKNVVFLHKKFVIAGNLVILGFGGGGFAREEEEFREVEGVFSDLVKQHSRSILLTHGPPYKTKLDNVYDDYYSGCKTYRRFIEKNQPTIAISGHIHETFRVMDKIGKTILVNPGPGGAIIEL
ncbi:MAG: metallophosphoesterase family protein [Candidatus Nanoarchaeia archaeon]